MYSVTVVLIFRSVSLLSAELRNCYLSGTRHGLLCLFPADLVPVVVVVLGQL
jgi:hypothetical protein